MIQIDIKYLLFMDTEAHKACFPINTKYKSIHKMQMLPQIIVLNNNQTQQHQINPHNTQNTPTNANKTHTNKQLFN